MIAAELAFPQRKVNAAQAWHEWLPIRDTATNLLAINRTLQFGASTYLLHAVGDTHHIMHAVILQRNMSIKWPDHFLGMMLVYLCIYA